MAPFFRYAKGTRQIAASDGALESTRYHIAFRDLDVSRGEVVAGTATNEAGQQLDFAIAIEGASIPSKTLKDLGGRSALISTSDWSEAYGVGSPTSKTRSHRNQLVDMSLRIESELCDAWQGKSCGF